MSPPRTVRSPTALARYTPDSRRWRRRIAALAAAAAPLAAYAGLAIISGVKSGPAYNTLIAVFGILALTLPAVAAASLLAPDSGTTRPEPTRGSNVTERSPSSDRTGVGDAVEILKSRYAAGEIGDEEFERRLGTLVETDEVGPGSRGDDDSVGRTPRRGEVESARR
ncbi:SHOCT domain-containing protein [Halopelagius longus]|uniref:SHOCT domain-containing protein n=1 Tax=Halopelagius longus TaxID=1236180 RepID=A0A1H1D8T2_9EURY|nr:SHOCT domain-containing protein [Halopelagius longus]RDI71215.1 SHOCT domain-containing protein [Halopelagius longus]SDQ72599.1 Short C-terminal domain-containing protein [Halopelagius longus]